MTTLNPSVEMQAALEARATRLAGVDLKACTDPRTIFGSAKEWVMEVGPFRLFLVPFLGEWWFFDEPHGEWRFTGKKIGEARFSMENDGLHILEGPAAAYAAPQEAPAQSQGEVQEQPQQKPNQQPQEQVAASAPVRRFCATCGAPVQPNWKFCRKCGSKLLAPP